MNNIKGDMVGDIESIFFGDLKQTPQSSPQTTSVDTIKEQVKTISEEVSKTQNKTNSEGRTVIQITNDPVNLDDIEEFVLTELEEKRFNTFNPRDKYFIDIETGEEVKIVEKTTLYNGTFLYTVKHIDEDKLVTYPRKMFVGNFKRFVPKDYYIREAERSIEDTIDKETILIKHLLEKPDNLQETEDGVYLELLLEEPIPILNGIHVPDKIEIPVKRMFDMDYKILMLEKVICLDDKIASLLFVDYWF